MKVVLTWRNPPAWVRSLAGPGFGAPSQTREEKREALEKRLRRLSYYQRSNPMAATPLGELLDRRSRWEIPQARPLRAGFQAPVKSDAITIVGAPLEAGRGVTVLPAKQWQKLHLSRTRLLAATPPVLRQVVACVECSLMALPKLCEAIVVLNTVEQGILQPGEREMLWRCFGLPVYEQWLGLEGELLAWECEAHQGLHVKEEVLDWEVRDGQILATSLVARKRVTRNLETGWAADIDVRPCVCGESGVRLRSLRNWQPGMACAAVA